MNLAGFKFSEEEEEEEKFPQTIKSEKKMIKSPRDATQVVNKSDKGKSN